MTTKPLLCIVTDRRRLAEAQGRPVRDACELLLQQVEGAIAGGVDLVQIRERDLDDRRLARLVADAVAVAKGSATRVLVNDRIDVAIAAGAAGVHLRESSMAASDVRRIAPQLFVGRSVHNAASAAAAGPVDYLIAGTVFPTASKSGHVRPISLAGLAEVVRAAAGTPVLAIGGIVSEVVQSIQLVGVSGVAAIGAFIPEGAAGDLQFAVRERAHAMRLAFDSDRSVP